MRAKRGEALDALLQPRRVGDEDRGRLAALEEGVVDQRVQPAAALARGRHEQAGGNQAPGALAVGADLVGVSHRTRREPFRWAEADDLVTVGVTVDGQLAGADGEIAAVERARGRGNARAVEDDNEARVARGARQREAPTGGRPARGRAGGAGGGGGSRQQLERATTHAARAARAARTARAARAALPGGEGEEELYGSGREHALDRPRPVRPMLGRLAIECLGLGATEQLARAWRTRVEAQLDHAAVVGVRRGEGGRVGGGAEGAVHRAVGKGIEEEVTVARGHAEDLHHVGIARAAEVLAVHWHDEAVIRRRRKVRGGCCHESGCREGGCREGGCRKGGG